LNVYALMIQTGQKKYH